MWCRRHDRSRSEEPWAASASPIDRVDAVVRTTAGVLSRQFRLIPTCRWSSEAVNPPDGS